MEYADLMDYLLDGERTLNMMLQVTTLIFSISIFRVKEIKLINQLDI